MSVNAVEMPPISDPLVLSYLRVCNTIAPTTELQKEFETLRLQFGELCLACEDVFQRVDEVRHQQLVEERTQIGLEAETVLAQMDAIGKSSGLNTALQTHNLADKRDAARNKLAKLIATQ